MALPLGLAFMVPEGAMQASKGRLEIIIPPSRDTYELCQGPTWHYNS